MKYPVLSPPCKIGLEIWLRQRETARKFYGGCDSEYDDCELCRRVKQNG